MTGDIAATQRLVAMVLIVTATAAAAGRVLSTQKLSEPSLARDETDPDDRRPLWPKARPAPMPTFSSNDCSRWATVRALVDKGTYAIGARDRTLIVATALTPLGTLDPLQAAVCAQAGYALRTTSDRGIIFEEGWQSLDKVLHPEELTFYSSKPPLLSTLVAGLYWLLQQLFGWTLAAQPNAVVRTILLLVNVAPFFLYLWLVWRLLERHAQTDWGRFFVLAAAGFGTLVTPFLITLNNHTVGTFCVLFSLVSVLAIWEGRSGPGRASWNHFVSAGFFSAFAVCNELPALAYAAAVLLLLLTWDCKRTLRFFLPGALLPLAGFFLTNYLAVGQLRPAYSEFGNIWYTYEGSYWSPPAPGTVRRGIDYAWTKESRLTYAFHVLFGHHGLFSLTPLWLLSIGGALAGTFQVLVKKGGSALPWFVQPLTLALTAVVVAFYLVKSDNYGGWTLGLRWLMWLTPLWLLCLVPAADRLAACRWGRGLGYVLLGFSIVAVTYSPWNPWRHPYLYDWLVFMEWHPGY